MLGRRHLRHGHAFPPGRPVGTAARGEEPPEEHAHADAAARPERRRLPPLRRRCRARVLRARRRERHGHLPHLRCAQRHAEPRDRLRGREARGRPRAGHALLHDKSGAYRRELRHARRAAGRDGRGLALHQGHGGASEPGDGRAARDAHQGRPSGRTPAAPLPRHIRLLGDGLPAGHSRRRERDRHRHQPARGRHLAAGHGDARRGASRR